MPRGVKEDLSGEVFGKLKVIKRDMTRTRPHYICSCECGGETIVRADCLKNGNTKSCGCIGHHGLLDSPLYSHWSNMKNRCLNPKAKNKEDYSCRGITVCEEWINSFESFNNWAINNGYKEGLFIDRIDVNGNYEPSNCRWATPLQQANNKRNTVYLTLGDRTQSMSDWARELGINQRTIQSRYYRGWSHERILTK